MLKKTINLVLIICLLTPKIGQAQTWWEWLWGTNKESTETSLQPIRPLDLSHLTSLERVQAYRRDILQQMVSEQVQMLDEAIKSLRLDLSKDLDEETRKFTVVAINRAQKSLNFAQRHGVQAYLGLIQWPDDIFFAKKVVRVNESGRDHIFVDHLIGSSALNAARKDFLEKEAAFQAKYELTNREMNDLEEELKREYPGVERKETGALFSPIEQDRSPGLSSNRLLNSKQNIGTTWKITMPGTFSESRFTGGSEMLNRLRQWWQAKPSSMPTMRQQLGEKTRQISQQYKESTPTTFGEAKFRNSGQMLQKIRERWQNNKR